MQHVRRLVLVLSAALVAAPASVALATLLAAPFSAAHPDGTVSPKTQCETFADTGTHDYGPPAIGSGLYLPRDAAVPPCPYGDTTWDGHLEWALGGAWLQAAASVCTDAYPDHAPGATITVVDAVLTTQLGSDVAFSVYADYLNNDPIPSEPNCGDWESDYGIDCVNSCAPSFPPGLDGTYQVFVSGTMGHVFARPTYPPRPRTIPRGRPVGARRRRRDAGPHLRPSGPSPRAPPRGLRRAA